MKQRDLPFGDDLQLGSVESIYREMLDCYPAKFRIQYKDEMAEIFAVSLSKLQGESVAVRTRYLLHVFRDWVRSMTGEWWDAFHWEGKFGLFALLATVILNLIGHAYYSVAFWSLTCLLSATAFFSLVRPRRLSRPKVVGRFAALVATGFFAPSWLRLLHHTSHAGNSYTDAARAIGMVAGTLVSVMYYLRSSHTGNAPRRSIIPWLLDSWPISLWFIASIAPIVGADHFMGYSIGVGSSFELFFVTNSFLISIQCAYMSPANSVITQR